MSWLPALYHERLIRRQENQLFFKRWIRHPARLGTVAPITPKLASLAARQVVDKDGLIVEIGAGTGRLTRALLAHGVQPKNLAVVELDEDLCNFLKLSLTKVVGKDDLPTIIQGDANYLDSLLPRRFIGKINTIVSVIPFMYLSPADREKLIQAAFKVMRPGGDLLHVTYSPRSPLAFSTSLEQTKVGSTWLNLPPGFIWKYRCAELPSEGHIR